MLDTTNYLATNQAKILLLEDEPKTIETHEDELNNLGINYDVLQNVDELLEILNSELVYSVAGITLDVMLDMPAGMDNADSYLRHAGCWVYREILRPQSDNEIVKLAYKKATSSIPVSFLTQNPNDTKLKKLETEEATRGVQVFRFTKSNDQKPKFRKWAKNVVENFKWKKNYNDSLISAWALLRTIGLKEEEILKAIGINQFNQELISGIFNVKDGGQIYENIFSLAPFEKTLMPMDSIERWERISEIVSQVLTIYNNNVKVAMEDFGMNHSELAGKSALQVLRDGVPSELINLSRFIEGKWSK